MDLREEIELYTPFNAQEKVDRHVMLGALDCGPACFERTAPAHMTCSIWTIDPTARQTLLVYHNIYNHGAGSGAMRTASATLPPSPSASCGKRRALRARA